MIIFFDKQSILDCMMLWQRYVIWRLCRKLYRQTKISRTFEIWTKFTKSWQLQAEHRKRVLSNAWMLAGFMQHHILLFASALNLMSPGATLRAGTASVCGRKVPNSILDRCTSGNYQTSDSMQTICVLTLCIYKDNLYDAA